VYTSLYNCGAILSSNASMYLDNRIINRHNSRFNSRLLLF
jgi:hypothetical protein